MLSGCWYWCPDDTQFISMNIKEPTSEQTDLLAQCSQHDCDPICEAVVKQAPDYTENITWILECKVEPSSSGARVLVHYSNSQAACE